MEAVAEFEAVADPEAEVAVVVEDEGYEAEPAPDDPNAFVTQYEQRDDDLYFISTDPETGEPTATALSSVLTGDFATAWEEARAAGAPQFEVPHPEMDTDTERAYIENVLTPAENGQVTMESRTVFKAIVEPEQEMALEESPAAPVQAMMAPAFTFLEGSDDTSVGMSPEKPKVEWWRPLEPAIIKRPDGSVRVNNEVAAPSLIDFMEQPVSFDPEPFSTPEKSVPVAVTEPETATKVAEPSVTAEVVQVFENPAAAPVPDGGGGTTLETVAPVSDQIEPAAPLAQVESTPPEAPAEIAVIAEAATPIVAEQPAEFVAPVETAAQIEEQGEESAVQTEVPIVTEDVQALSSEFITPAVEQNDIAEHDEVIEQGGADEQEIFVENLPASEQVELRAVDEQAPIVLPEGESVSLRSALEENIAVATDTVATNEPAVQTEVAETELKQAEEKVVAAQPIVLKTKATLKPTANETVADTQQPFVAKTSFFKPPTESFTRAPASITADDLTIEFDDEQNQRRPTRRRRATRSTKV